MNKRVAVTVVVLFACLAAVFSSRLIFHAKQGDEPGRGVLARAKGNPLAPLQIVEYFDFQCKSCRESSLLVDSYLKKYPDELFVQAKFYPLKSHQHSLRSALFAGCAARQGLFWKMNDILFENQEALAMMTSADEALYHYAKRVGMDVKKLDQCLKDPNLEKTVMDEKNEGILLGVRVTPTFFINGKMVVGPKEFMKFMEEHLAKKEKGA